MKTTYRSIFIAVPAAAAIPALARAEPGDLTYASSGVGSPGHFAG